MKDFRRGIFEFVGSSSFGPKSQVVSPNAVLIFTGLR